MGQSTRVRSGNNLTLNLNLTFNPGFAGAKSVFTEALNNSSLSSNWQTVGSYTVAAGTNAAPALNSLTRNSGSGTNAIFRFQLSDPNGGGDLDRLQVIIKNGFNPLTPATCTTRRCRAWSIWHRTTPLYSSAP